MTTPEVSWIAILPDVLLALGAAFVLLIDVQWKPKPLVLGATAGATIVLALAVSLLQWFQAGDAMAVGSSSELVKFSGLVVMDGLAVFGRLALLVVTGLGLLAGWRFIQGLGRRAAEAVALVLLATAGFSIMVASNNLVMMFLGLEIGSIALYVIAGFVRDRSGSDEAAIKYFLLGSFASAIFIYGVSLMYAGTGHFDVLGMRRFLDSFVLTSPAILTIGIALVVVGLGFKISAAPFHTWAPDVYQGAPAGLVGYMAAMAKIAGFIAIGRILLTGVPRLSGVWLPAVAGIAALSMVVGAVLALVQGDVRRMLAYSGVAHAGFILTGVVGGSTQGILFYVAVYALQLLGAFAVVALVSGSAGSASALSDYRGLSARSPLLAVSFSILLLGMAGLPLTSGFIAKFNVFTGAWAGGYRWLVIVALLASVVAFAFYLRVIVAMFMEDDDGSVIDVPSATRWALLAAVAGTVIWGILPGSLLDIVSRAIPL